MSGVHQRAPKFEPSDSWAFLHTYLAESLRTNLNLGGEARRNFSVKLVGVEPALVVAPGRFGFHMKHGKNGSIILLAFIRFSRATRTADMSAHAYPTRNRSHV